MYIKSLIDLWSSLGIQDATVFIKRLQIPIDDGRVNVHDVRTVIDAAIRDHPMGNLILGSLVHIRTSSYFFKTKYLTI